MVDPVNTDNFRIGMKIIVNKYEGIRSNTASSEDMLEDWRQKRDAIMLHKTFSEMIFLLAVPNYYRDYPSYLTQ